MVYLRLLIFNIAHGRGLSPFQGLNSERSLRYNLARISRLLKKHQVDIVAMQEVDEDSHWNKHLNLMEIIKDKGGYEHGCIGVNRRSKQWGGLAYGNALLSKYPIQKSVSQAFQGGDIGKKGFLYVELEVNGLNIPVLNLHLNHRSKRIRMAQIEEVKAFLDQKEATGVSPIICGDFNTHEGRKGDAVRHLYEYVGSREAYRLYPEARKGEATFPAYMPLRTLDCIFLPDEYKACSCTVLDEQLSDHRPVLLEFEVSRAAIQATA